MEGGSLESSNDYKHSYQVISAVKEDSLQMVCRIKGDDLHFTMRDKANMLVNDNKKVSLCLNAP